MRILSFGGGHQSTTVLRMSALGELEKLDAAIFSDTGWEKPEVYRHIGEVVAEVGHKIPVFIVGRGTIRSDALTAQVHGKRTDGVRWGSLPYFTKEPGKKPGMVSRQCTDEYKVKYINAKVREIVGVKPRARPKEILVEQWIGISTDEASRMRDNKLWWIQNRYPLIEKRMSRHDCAEWHKRRGYPIPPSSSCVGCPFHSDKEWRHIKADPKLWADAVEFDRQIRKCGGMRSDMFLHAKRIPLDQVDLTTAEDHGQLELWENECEGHCGV